jgi:hypothetical protein
MGPRRGRRPARRVARAAAVGGTAYAVGKHRARKQDEAAAQQEYQQQEMMAAQQPPPAQQPPAAATQEDTIEELKKLGELRDSGVLTEEEFQREKRKILGG